MVSNTKSVMWWHPGKRLHIQDGHYRDTPHHTLGVLMSRFTDHLTVCSNVCVDVTINNIINWLMVASAQKKCKRCREWWHHQMETFIALLILCEGNPTVTGGFPSQRPVTRSFDVFFDLRPNRRLSTQSRRRWFKTPSRSLWRHCNGMHILSRHESVISTYIYTI